MPSTNGNGSLRPLSADSHVTEPPALYAKFIDPEFRDRAPYMVRHETKGDIITIPDSVVPISVGVIAAAGKDPKTITTRGVTFDQLHRGGWDPEVRMADQDRDGIGGEVIYPTVGMALCSHPDGDYKRACFRAYNRWLVEFVGAAPDRLWGIGQLHVDENIDRVIRDIREIKDQGFKGVMVPGAPQTWEEHDYDDPIFDPVWDAVSDLKLPVSVHAATGPAFVVGVGKQRGNRLCQVAQVMRLNQDLVMLFTFGGVFDRCPDLRLVSVEADAGWLPHLMYRMDHGYDYHRFWNRAKELQRRPSDYVLEHFYFTFQDDYTAFLFKDHLNIKRLLWATDFPHSDSTWPRSMEVLDKNTRNTLNAEERALVVRDNLVDLYGL